MANKKARKAAAKKGWETRRKNQRRIERQMYEQLLKVSGEKKKRPQMIDVESEGDWEAEGTGELDS